MAFVPCNLQEDEETPIAFVAGATGYVGREVVRELRKREIITVAHVRPDSSRLSEWKKRFTSLGAKVDTTSWDEKAMARRFSQIKPSHIFCLIGTIRSRMKKEKVSYDSIDHGLTALLVKAVQRAKISPRFVYVSAAGVKEGSRSPYYKARWKAEEAIKESGLPYTIARPSFITGPTRDDRRLGEEVGSQLIDVALTAAGLLGAKKLKERYKSTTNKTLAKTLVRLSLDEKEKNKIVESENLRE